MYKRENDLVRDDKTTREERVKTFLFFKMNTIDSKQNNLSYLWSEPSLRPRD